MKRGFTKTIVKEEINTDDNVASRPLTSKLIRGSREQEMERGFTMTTVKEEINTDNNVASNPLKSNLIRGSREHGLKRGYIGPIVLPEEGIYADDGFLFHHKATDPHLSPQMIWRLCEHGIIYKFNKLFSREEDEIIRNNWKEFAEEYNIPMSDVLIYTGRGDRENGYVTQEVIDRRYFRENTNFWPRMCKGLECRSGRQIRRRMLTIFDEEVINGRATIQYGKSTTRRSLSDLTNYLEAFPKCNYVQSQAAKKTGITYTAIMSLTGHLRQSQGNFGRKDWKCLWNTVDRLVQFPQSFCEVYRKAIMRHDRFDLARLTKIIRFNVLSNILVRTRKTLKEGWNELTDELVKEYNRAYDRPKTEKDAFEEACNKVFSERAFITPIQYSLFLRLLLKCLKEDAVSKTKMKKKYFHMDRLANMMLDYGISGFHVFDPSMSEVECMYSHAKIHLSECDSELPSNISRTLTLKEKIQLFTKSYDMQFRHICKRSNVFPIEGENCKTNYVITKDGYPCFKMRIYYRVIFQHLHSQRLDDNDSDSSDEED